MLTEHIELQGNGAVAVSQTDPTSGIAGAADSRQAVDHFIVVHLSDGADFIPILKCPEGTYRDHSDPYCEAVLISGSAESESMRTHVIFDCDSYAPKWNEYLKFRADPGRYPEEIEIRAFDKSDDVRMADAKYGCFRIHCRSEGMFVDAAAVYESVVELEMGAKIRVRVGLITESAAAQRAKMKAFRARNYECHFEQSPETVRWMDSNTELFSKLCALNTEGIQLNDDTFQVMVPPPTNYNVLHHFERFQGLFGSAPGLMQLYFDRHCKMLYAVNPEKVVQSEHFRAHFLFVLSFLLLFFCDFEPHGVLRSFQGEDNLQFGGMDISHQVHILWRYEFLKNHILAGQDSEFNIYKSYIIDPSPQKLVFCVVAVTLQVCDSLN